MTDSMEGKTLGEACQNPDGTYDGRRLVKWLYFCTTGKNLTDKEVEEILEDAKRRAAEKRKR